MNVGKPIFILAIELALFIDVFCSSMSGVENRFFKNRMMGDVP